MWGKIRGIAATIILSSTIVYTPFAASATDPNAPAECQVTDVIVGTPGDDVLSGTPGDDVICGLDGNDQINGLGGNDVIFGNNGDDEILGSDGNDELLGGSGDDLENGGNGDDEIGGDDGTDMLYGGPGADNLFGGNGPDSLLGGDGNDGLRGDEGADTLTGDTGVNVCEKDLTDTVSGCYYDNKGPIVISAAVDPLTKNTHALQSNSRVHVRFLVVDQGTGVNNVGFQFSWVGVHKDRMQHGIQDIDAAFDLASSPTCAELVANTQVAGVCLFKGNINRGIYDAYLATSIKNMDAGKWELSYISASDKAGNTSHLFGKEISSKKLNVNFRQVDTGVDIWGPQLTPIGFKGSKKQSSASDYVRFRIKVKDATGIASYSSMPWGISSEPVSGTIDDSTPICSDQVADDQVCLESNSRTSTIIQIPVQYRNSGTNPDYWVKGKKNICFCSFDVIDSLGNDGNFTFDPNSNQGKFLTIYKDYRTDVSGDDKDRSMPKLVSITANPTTIDTGSEQQSVELTIRLTDTGVGFTNMDANLRMTLKGASASSGEIDCGQHEPGVGTVHSMTIQVTCIVPAHYPRGKMRIFSITASDGSIRQNQFFSSVDTLYKAMPSNFAKFRITNG